MDGPACDVESGKPCHRKPLVYEISVHAAYLWAVFSVLLCLLVWWFPHVYPVSEVRS